jgi:hypothetical protein
MECFVIIRAYLDWPLKPVAKNCQIIEISLYPDILMLCVKKFCVMRALEV